MPYAGVIIHHSACPSINGKGYDFFVTGHASVIPAAYPTDPNYIHVCLEGDFSEPRFEMTPERKEQFFVASKLILRLSEALGFEPDDLFPHTATCPGPHFPWDQLVISDSNGYH